MNTLQVDEVTATRLALAPGEILLVRVAPNICHQEQAERMRDAFVAGFREAGVEIDPRRILIAAGEFDVRAIGAADTPEAFEADLAHRFGGWLDERLMAGRAR